nr:Chain A, Consensus engineered intein CatN [Escherichia phage T7]
EFEALSGDTMIEILDDDGIIQKISMEDLYQRLA